MLWCTVLCTGTMLHCAVLCHGTLQDLVNSFCMVWTDLGCLIDLLQMDQMLMVDFLHNDNLSLKHLHC